MPGRYVLLSLKSLYTLTVFWYQECGGPDTCALKMERDCSGMKSMFQRSLVTLLSGVFYMGSNMRHIIYRRIGFAAKMGHEAKRNQYASIVNPATQSFHSAGVRAWVINGAMQQTSSLGW